MKRANKKLTKLQKVITLLVIAALAVSGIIQYSWLNKNAWADIQSYQAGIRANLFKAITDEFMIFPFWDQRMPFFHAEGIEDEFRNRLEDLFQHYDINNYQYMHSIRYTSNLDDNSEHVFTGTDWKINQPPLAFDTKADHPYVIQESRNATLFYFPLIKRRESKSYGYLVFEFDVLSYYRTVIEDAINDLYPDYTFKWTYAIDSPDFKYTSMDFTVLSYLLNNEQDIFKIRIPLHAIFQDIEHNRRLEGPPEFDEEKPVIKLQIYKDSRPLQAYRMDDIVWKWVISMLLLAAVGTAFIITMVQIARIHELRRKEQEFVASVTHELRTPLTVINSAADNLANTNLKTDRIKQYGHLIQNQSKRLSDLIENILLFSRFEGGKQAKTVLSSITKEQLYDELITICDSFKNPVNINFESIPESFCSNKEMLVLILSNLLINAEKHAYNGQMKKPIRLNAHIQIPDSLIFEIEDEGNGINKDEISEIFEAFYRCQDSWSQQISGTGLGLHLAKRTASALGGKLKVESPYAGVTQQQQGCRFTLTIPYITEEMYRKKEHQLHE